MPVVPEVLREDPEAVARLLRFAPVGVEDAEAEVGARGGHAQEDPVGTDTPVPVAEATNHRRRERRRQIRLIDHDVVVAEPVALREADHARPSSTRRPVAADTYPA